MVWADCQAILFQREYRLDLHSDITRQRTHPHRTARADPFVRPPDRGKQFAAAIDDLRMFLEGRSAVDHPEDFDDPLDLIQAP